MLEACSKRQSSHVTVQPCHISTTSTCGWKAITQTGVFEHAVTATSPHTRLFCPMRPSHASPRHPATCAPPHTNRTTQHANAAALTCVLSRSHFSPLLLAVAGRANGTRPQVGPSRRDGLISLLPARSSRTKLPSPHSVMLRCG